MSVVEEKSLKTRSLLQNYKDNLRRKSLLFPFLKNVLLVIRLHCISSLEFPHCGICGNLNYCYPFYRISGCAGLRQLHTWKLLTFYIIY